MFHRLLPCAPRSAKYPRDAHGTDPDAVGGDDLRPRVVGNASDGRNVVPPERRGPLWGTDKPWEHVLPQRSASVPVPHPGRPGAHNISPGIDIDDVGPPLAAGGLPFHEEVRARRRPRGGLRRSGFDVGTMPRPRHKPVRAAGLAGVLEAAAAGAGIGGIDRPVSRSTRGVHRGIGREREREEEGGAVPRPVP